MGRKRLVHPVEDTTIVAFFHHNKFLAVRSAHDTDGIAAVQRDALAGYVHIDRLSIPVGKALPSHAPWTTADRARAKRIAVAAHAANDGRVARRRIMRTAHDRIDDRPVLDLTATEPRRRKVAAPDAVPPRLNWLVWDARDTRARGIAVHAANAIAARAAYCDQLGLAGALPVLHADFIPAA